MIQSLAGLGISSIKISGEILTTTNNTEVMNVDVLSIEPAYSGFFKLNRYAIKHSLFAGGMSSTIHRECFERGHAVAVLAFDPIKNKIILLEQFRIGAWVNNQQGWMYEVIAGIIEPQQSPEEVAHREAREEADCELLDMEFICDYYSSPGGSSETLHLYCAAVDSEGIGGLYGLETEGEDIRATVVDYDEAVKWLKEGKLNNASTIICMQWLILNHQRLVGQWKNIY